MQLTKLLSGVSYKLEQGSLNEEISGVFDNSKQCVHGSVFVALNGNNFNGNNFVKEAINNGAKVIVCENNIEECDENVTVIKVEDARSVLSKIAFNFYLPAGFSFKVIGITGTNGKTTISFMLAEIIKKCGKVVCVVGTSGIFVNGDELRGEGLTTPDPLELARLFAFLNEIGVDYVVMEVSAHALFYEKTAAINFDYGIFTNLTQDHLDFFKTMENYAAAKIKLFNQSKCAIVNIDDDYGKHIASKYSCITYGTKDAEYNVKLKHNSFVLKHNNKRITIKLNISGEYNCFNAAAAFIVAEGEKLGLQKTKQALKKLPQVKGRFNVFNTKNYGKVILDFAHTPDGLEKVLMAARKETTHGGKLISVFGCGGNRDKEKRSIMGKVSASLADYTIISIDNPRYEDEKIVMADIEKGVKKITNNYKTIMPRTKAIRAAIELTKPGDVIVVSGKGCEPYYEVCGIKHFYREDIVIKTIIKNLESN